MVCDEIKGGSDPFIYLFIYKKNHLFLQVSLE